MKVADNFFRADKFEPPAAIKCRDKEGASELGTDGRTEAVKMRVMAKLRVLCHPEMSTRSVPQIRARESSKETIVVWVSKLASKGGGCAPI